MFKDGQVPNQQNNLPAALLLTNEALLVCQLLAIDPEDIIARDISNFQESNEKITQ
jgi:hypothetical protein